MEKIKLNNYASALIEVAYENKKLDKIVDDFDNLYVLLKYNPKFMEILRINDYTEVVSNSFYDNFDIDFKDFLLLLKEHRLSKFIPDIYRRFRKMADVYEKIAFIRVYSAQELNQNQKDNLFKNLEKIIPGKKIIGEFKVDKTLLAGLKIIYQGKNLDFTYEKYLEDLFKYIGGKNNGQS